jgi:hypothetical protein
MPRTGSFWEQVPRVLFCAMLPKLSCDLFSHAALAQLWPLVVDSGTARLRWTTCLFSMAEWDTKRHLERFWMLKSGPYVPAVLHERVRGCAPKWFFWTCKIAQGQKMGEVATTLSAFRSEFNKASASLCFFSGDSGNHDSIHRQYIYCLRVQDVLEHYSPKLLDHVLAPILLEHARRLIQKNHLKLALNCCYANIIGMGLLQHDSSGKNDYTLVDRTRDHMQALVGRAICVAGLANMRDPEVKHVDTLKALMAALQV